MTPPPNVAYFYLLSEMVLYGMRVIIMPAWPGAVEPLFDYLVTKAATGAAAPHYQSMPKHGFNTAPYV